MELFHTSPLEDIGEITEAGRFGSFLFFSSRPYTPGLETSVYRLDINEGDIIEASQIFYHADAAKLSVIVRKVMNMLDCDEDEAERQLEQRGEFTDADSSWDIQRLTAECAKMLGYRGVSMQDESGTVYLIDMLGRENDLDRVK